MIKTLLSYSILLGSLIAQTTVPVRMVVTVEAHHSRDVPEVHREDVQAYQGKDRVRVTDWTPLRGEHAGLQLYLLIDDGADTSLGTQIDDLRKFVQAQPASAQIGIAYMRNGAVQLTQAMTADHDRAAKAIRLPLGDYGIAASPYQALTDLIQKWPETHVRREVLMVTSGIDQYYTNGLDNPYLDRAIHDAERAGIVVHSIYFSPAGHFAHSYARINWGQSYLSQLADGTGGESYWLGNGNPVSFSPFLDDLRQRLNNQYLLTFAARGEEKAGFQPVKLRTEIPHVELVGADKVYVPAGR
ncbi:MAG: hypothetical protein ACR2NN_27710 [Bryobacteraceae bacterium]